MNFKSKLQESIVNPVGYSDRAFQTEALVTKADEKRNTCSIKYVNNEGHRSNRDSVPVRVYTKGIIGWFPEKNDMVIVEIRGKHIEIVSTIDSAYLSNVRSMQKLKSDIMSDSLIDTSNGFLF